MPIVLMLFVLIPIAEMWLLIEVGSRIGALPTIGLVLLTAVIGLALLRQQGFSTLMRARQKMETGQIPAQEVGEGIFLAVGGALLLTPGFITDFIGFCCLIPGIRHLLIGALLKRMRVTSVMGTAWQQPPGQVPPYGTSEDGDGEAKSHHTLEGEYRRED